MAAPMASASGLEPQGDARRRNVGQTNGSYIPKPVEEQLDEKTKEKVRYPP